MGITGLYGCATKKFGGDCTKLCEMSIYIGQIRTYPEDRELIGVHPCQINKGNCSEICMLSNQDPYFTCVCGDYSELAEDQRSCDKKPCTKSNGKCSMICVDLGKQNYKCLCEKGFQLSSDNKTCVGELRLTAFFRLGKGWQYSTLHLNPNVDFRAYPSVNSVDNISYDPVKRQIFYKVRSEDDTKIWKSNIYGKGIFFKIIF